MSKILSIEQAYKECPDLEKITYNDLNGAFSQILYEFDRIDFTKTFGEQGFDELDCVELVMYLESKLNISITDDVFDFVFNVDSNLYFIISIWRNQKINEILNDKKL